MPERFNHNYSGFSGFPLWSSNSYHCMWWAVLCEPKHHLLAQVLGVAVESPTLKTFADKLQIKEWYRHCLWLLEYYFNGKKWYFWACL